MKPLIQRDVWIDQQGEIIERIIEDMEILSGDAVGPSGESWQDIADKLATNLEVLAGHIRKIRNGKHAVGHSSHLTMLLDQLSESVSSRDLGD